MRTRLISLVILLAVGAGAVAGMPLHSNEQSCPMGGAMDEMDCCKKAALAQGPTNEVSAARICCAVNCPQEGTTPLNGTNVPKPTQTSLAIHPAVIPCASASLLLTPKLDIAHSPPADSHPVYIRHLALLI